MEGVQTVDVSWLHHSQKGKFHLGVSSDLGYNPRGGIGRRLLSDNRRADSNTFPFRSSVTHKIGLVDGQRQVYC